MKSNPEIRNELESLGQPLPWPAIQLPYSVPQGYFETLPESILARVSGQNQEENSESFPDAGSEIAQLSPLLAGLSRKMPFEVPSGYFDETRVNPALLNAVDSEDADTGFLSGLPKAMPFVVPQGYFESLPELILARVNERQQAKVVPMFRKTWVKMAVAAVVAGLVAVGGFLYLSKPSTISVDNPGWVSTQLHNVPDKALDDFMNTADGGSTARTRSPQAQDNKSMFRNVSEKQLQAFLDEIPADDLSSMN